MLQEHITLYALLKKYLVSLALATVALSLVAATATADDNNKGGNAKKQAIEPAVRLLKTVAIPVSNINTTSSAMYSFDISWVDQVTGNYYLADRSNKAVDAVSAETFVTQIFPNNGHAAFAGFTPCSPPAGANDCAGPNGVVAAFPWLFVTDAPSRVLSFDLRTSPPTTVSEVFTKAGEKTRADELAYDPRDGLLLVINNASDPPFGTLIQVNKATGVLTVVKNIDFDAAHGVDAQNGAEQPVWEPVTGKFYLSIPQIGATVSHGGVVRIAPNAASVSESDVFGVDFCSPAGLAVGPPQDLFIGCNMVFD